MVRGLLQLLFGMSTMCSCILSNPPDNDDETTHRPVVVLRDPGSDIVRIVKDDTEVQTTTFQADIWDGDVEDYLSYRWFLDFRQEPATQCGLERDFISIPPTPRNEIRTAVFNLNHNRLSTGVCHRLTLAVTDGEWRDGPHAGCAEVAEGANRVIVHWWLEAYRSSEGAVVTLEDCLSLAGEVP
jgi:hypothetical protein